MIQIAFCRRDGSLLPAHTAHPRILHTGIGSAGQHSAGCQRISTIDQICPISVMRVFYRMRTVPRHIRVVHWIASQQVVHSGYRTVIVLLIPGQQISVGDHDCIICHGRIGSPDIPLVGIIVCDLRCPVRLTVTLCFFFPDIGIRCGDHIGCRRLFISGIHPVPVHTDTHGSERCRMPPVKAGFRTDALTPVHSRREFQKPGRVLHIFIIRIITGRDIQLGGRPVKLIRCIIVTIGTATHGFIQRRIHRRMCFGRCVGTFCHIQTGCRECIIYALPQSGRLRCACRHIQRRCSRGRLDDTVHRIFRRRNTQSGPLLIVHLMVCHIPALAVLHEHLHHPLHLPACFIQQIRIAVVVLGKIHRSVRISSCRSRPYRCLVLVLHHPE